MKKFVLAIGLLTILIGTAMAGTIFRGLGTRLNVPCLSPMSAAGAFGTADSAQVISYRDDGSSTTAVRSFTSITNMVAATGWFDSTKDAGGTNWWLNVYVDSLAGSTPTGKMVAVKVKIFTAGSWSETNFNVYVSSGMVNMMSAFDGTGGVALNLNQLKVISTSDTAVVFATSASGKPAFARMNTNASGAAGSNGDYVSSANREAAKYYASSSSSTAASAILYQSASSGAPAVYIYNSNGGDGIYYYDGTFQGSFLPVGYMGIGTVNATAVADNAIGAGELADDAAREIASHILKDTTKRIGFKGGLGDSVLTPTPSVSATISTADKQDISRIILGDSTKRVFTGIFASADTAKRIPFKSSAGSDSLRSSVGVPTGMSTLTTSDNIGVNLSDISGTLDSTEVGEGTYQQIAKRVLNDTTKRIKFSNDSVVAVDPIRTVAATVAGGATAAALATAQDSLNALTAITRADSNLTKAVRDTAHIIDSIVKLILPLATQARDTLLTFPTWLAARFDTMMVAAGWADSSRTTNTYLNDADTVRVYKGENLWFKYIRLHPAHVPGYRPDSTRGRGW